MGFLKQNGLFAVACSFGLWGVISAGLLAGCGGSSSEAEYDFELVGESSSSFWDLYSSDEIQFSSSGGIAWTEERFSSSCDYGSCRDRDFLQNDTDHESMENGSGRESLKDDDVHENFIHEDLTPQSDSSEHSSSSGIRPFENASSSSENPTSSNENPIEVSSSSVTPQKYSKYIVGADISHFQEYESYGTKIYDVDGTEKDIFTLLKDHGFNAIRLKTFLSPQAPYGYAAAGCGQDSEAFGDQAHVVAYAQKAKKAGFLLLLDFHYSDNWADPAKQIIPTRWRDVTNSDAMADSVYNYTRNFLLELKSVNALPDMVQIGNEITNGMLRDLPTSSTTCWGENVTLASGSVNGIMDKSQNPDGIDNTAKYLAAGSKAVKDVSSAIKTVFHIESPQNESTVKWWMSSIIESGKAVPDVMAFSAYTAYSHGNPDSWKSLMTNLASSYPSLEFLIAEYNGATSKDSYSFDGSRAKTHQIMEQVPRGLGAFLWEPASYGEWGTALFNWEGNSLKADFKSFQEYEVLF